MIQKQIKKYKLYQIQKIKQTFKYIYIFRCNNLKINENIVLKKTIKHFHYKSLRLKQNLINKTFLNIGGQGSIMLLYGNNNLNLVEKLKLLKKIEVIYLMTNDRIYSNLKLKNLFHNKEICLTFSIIKPFLKFLYYLRKIEKADIT